ncbi:MAG: DNA/RNA nuclease SfsA [Oscillospiraceae bacterium]
MSNFVFDTPLIEAVIRKRPNRFIMQVELDGKLIDCHCPTTGRIGNLILEDIACLLSKSTNEARKTPYTVEAISVDSIDSEAKHWIGINQNAANRYVEHYLKNGGFAEMIGTQSQEILREQKIGDSKLDFRVGDTYLEVKTPLQQLQIDIPAHIKTKKVTPFSSTDRMVRHVTELTNSLKGHERALFLSCFVYNNPGFQVTHKSTNHKQVSATIEASKAAGVELWQVNFEISPSEVKLVRYFKFSNN